jgi:hypothetical protein
MPHSFGDVGDPAPIARVVPVRAGTASLSREVHRGDESDLGRGEVERRGLAQRVGDGAGDRDLQPVQDPHHAEGGDHPRMER